MEPQQPPPEQDTKNNLTVESTGPVTWSIRGVEQDTRAVIERAAERTGKTLGQCVNEDIRRLVQGQLTQTQLPAAPVDIKTRSTT